jgi:hypothetical protein
MLDQWILSKLDPLRPAPLIVLRDPQRMIQPGAYVVHGWGEANGYAVFFCTGNLGLREMAERVRDDAAAHVLLVDRSRADGRYPLFYPDLAAAAGPRRQITLSLREFLVSQTGDAAWPPLVEERNLARLILAHLPGVLRAHGELRAIGGGRFSDSDLYRIVLGAALGINPFRQLSPAEVRRVCIQGHDAIADLGRILPEEVLAALRRTVASAPAPFSSLLDRDPETILRAFTLAALMRQHGLDHRLLLANLDPALHEYRDIAAETLDAALADQLTADPDQVMADVRGVEAFLVERPERLAFLLHEHLRLDDPEAALAVLRREKLSPLIRGLALVALLLDLIESKRLKVAAEVSAVLDAQAGDGSVLALRRPPAWWEGLAQAYRRAHALFQLTDKLVGHAKKLRVAVPDGLDFAYFDRLWNEEGLNRLDYYASDLERMLRVGDILPAPRAALWPELAAAWDAARTTLHESVEAIGQVQTLINTRFQDLLATHYAHWIRQPDGPVIFTHQCLPRLLRTHWDPRSGHKAVILVFDGLRTDAWAELLRPVFEERFEVITSRPGCALIPTETQLSRKAIAAGKLPVEFTSQRELELLRGWLKGQMGLAPQFQVVIDDDTIASGISVRYVSDELEYIVFNFTDENLHHNRQDLAFIYNVTVREIIRQDVRSVLRELPADALIFVTSDHGFTTVPDHPITIPGDLVADSGDVKYLNARTQRLLEGADAGHVLAFDADALGIPATSLKQRGTPARHVLFPRPGYSFRRADGRFDPDRYSHGGVSLAECLVPMVVLGPKGQAQPALAIESVRQVGSVSEGEPLTLEITVVPLASGLGDIAVTLSFSRDEIPVQRELFTGSAATYTVRWTPVLGEITEADRRREGIVQPVAAILTFRQGNRTIRLSKTTDVRIKLDPTRLRRRVDSKLDLLMGKTPKGLL